MPAASSGAPPKPATTSLRGPGDRRSPPSTPTRSAGPGATLLRTAAVGAAAGGARSPRSRCSRPTSAGPAHRRDPGTTPGVRRGIPRLRSPRHSSKPARPARAPSPTGAIRALSERPAGRFRGDVLWEADAHLRCGRHRRDRPPPGLRPGRCRARGDRLCPKPGEGGRPGPARSRRGGRRRIRHRHPDPCREGRAARGRGQPADRSAQDGEPDHHEEGLRRDEPAARRRLGRAGAGGPRRRCPTSRGPVDLVRLPARPGRAHRGRPALDRRQGTDRRAGALARRARVRDAGRRRDRGCGPPLWHLLPGPDTYIAPGGLYATRSPSVCFRSPARATACSVSCTSTTP